MGIKQKKPFSAALSHLLKMDGHGAQSKLGRKINKSPSYINELSVGVKDGTEKTRRKIAESFGYAYDDFLKLGERFLYGDVQSNIGFKSTIIAEKINNYEPLGKSLDNDVVKLVRMTKEILKSDNNYSNSLAAIIRSFYDAIETKRQLNAMQADIDNLR